MKLIKPSYEILTPIDGEQILKDIEIAARTCYKSEGKIEYEDLLNNYIAKSARVLLPKIIKRGHEAMLEFGPSITVKFIIDRGVSHELVRHRLASFAQESTRYCNYKGKEMEFIIPCWLNIKEGIYCDSDFMSMKNSGCSTIGDWQDAFHWFSALNRCDIEYKFLLEKGGWSPQQARSVLPNSLKTEINVKANIREWRHILKLRTAKAAHPQMREVMVPLLQEFQKKIPILFNDIN